jgi:hypothetical protein
MLLLEIAVVVCPREVITVVVCPREEITVAV